MFSTYKCIHVYIHIDMFYLTKVQEQTHGNCFRAGSASHQYHFSVGGSNLQCLQAGIKPYPRFRREDFGLGIHEEDARVHFSG